jgi:hypothetical protein
MLVEIIPYTEAESSATASLLDGSRIVHGRTPLHFDVAGYKYHYDRLIYIPKSIGTKSTRQEMDVFIDVVPSI